MDREKFNIWNIEIEVFSFVEFMKRALWLYFRLMYCNKNTLHKSIVFHHMENISHKIKYLLHNLLYTNKAIT